jgi:hypothetical protein
MALPRAVTTASNALELLRDELHDCMVLCGLNDIAGIPPGVVARCHTSGQRQRAQHAGADE